MLKSSHERIQRVGVTRVNPVVHVKLSHQLDSPPDYRLFSRTEVQFKAFWINIKILKSTSYFIMSDRDANVAKAKLAEQAERYDDMAEAMKLVRRSALYLRLTVYDFYSIFSLTKEIKIFSSLYLCFPCSLPECLPLRCTFPAAQRHTR